MVLMDLYNIVEWKIQSCEDDENYDVVAAFGESVIWWSRTEIAGFCIWNQISYRKFLIFMTYYRDNSVNVINAF